MQILHNPLYAGAYAFGRKAQRTRIVDGRARKVSGFAKPRDEWNVLLRETILVISAGKSTRTIRSSCLRTHI